MSKYLIMQNKEDTVCINANNRNLIKRCYKRGYQMIGNVKCCSALIDRDSLKITTKPMRNMQNG